jgi:hypothetical protein
MTVDTHGMVRWRFLWVFVVVWYVRLAAVLSPYDSFLSVYDALLRQLNGLHDAMYLTSIVCM